MFTEEMLPNNTATFDYATKWNVMHQSFVSTAPLGQGNSGAFNFSVYKKPSPGSSGVKL